MKAAILAAPARGRRLIEVFVLAALFVPAARGEEPRADKKGHWAWRNPVRPEVPAVKNKAWVVNPIDAFILSRLETAGLEPAEPAAKETLLRRVTFDLIGLPPTPGEVDAFLKDTSRDAWEKVINRLLASPHYGERWGRHWLDLARFAESNGFEFDEPRPNAWRYRDYVIRAFNQNKPYDRFVQEQLAGDELFPDDPEAILATGFNLLGPDMTDAANQVQRRQNTLDDMTDTAGLVFLGMTIGCARCHDHKFEPIPQTDFFRLQAFFAAAEFRTDLPVAEKEARRRFEEQLSVYQEFIQPTMEALAELERPHREKLREVRLAKLSEEAQKAHRAIPAKRTDRQKELVETTNRLLGISLKDVIGRMSPEEKGRHEALQKELKKFESRKPAPLPVAMGLRDKAEAPKTFLLRRGELAHRGEEVFPGWPVILTPGAEGKAAKIDPMPSGTGRRAALAKWLTQPDHPLTARVLVNRLWQQHFGRGIVDTASDFGVRGANPSHPELLDWLATEFVAKGWDIKHLHRLMLTSATYRQSTRVKAPAAAKDPDNRLFSRMNRLRLEGEIIRDSLLAVSGKLNPKMGGPGVFPPIPPEARKGAKEWKESPDPADHARRSVYIFARRNMRFPFLEVFDLPDSNLSCPKRERSTTAPQALALLNSTDVIEAATALAARLEKATAHPRERIDLLYRFAFARRPTAIEMETCQEFLNDSPLRELCRAVFNLNEFIYLD